MRVMVRLLDLPVDLAYLRKSSLKWASVGIVLNEFYLDIELTKAKNTDTRYVV